MNESHRRSISILFRNLLRRLRIRPDPILDADSLALFLKAQSAFVSQKTVVEYCRIKAGVRWQKLFGEAEFKAALEASRWISMRAVLCDLTVITEGYLRETARPRERAMADTLCEMAASILTGYERDARWRQESAAAIDELGRRLARAQMASPQTPDRIARIAGAAVFDALPVHSMLRAHDREVIVNNIRFGATRFREDLIARATDKPALVASLLGNAGSRRRAG